MAKDPILIIQMQRMGDVILTFPLLSRLMLSEPDRPLWVVAEPQFFRELMPLSPNGVTYMGPDMAAPLQRTPLETVINLSHREDAARLAGSVSARSRAGIFRRPSGIYIKGVWALYRHSIVHNNRHNRFHWADLQALDFLSSSLFGRPAWPEPRRRAASGRVGLFVGASEPEKRPDAPFWGALARRLAARGAQPVFLGGPDDRALAHEAVLHAGLDGRSNLAGRFRLSELARFFEALDLVVTPDTGPMHLAAWTGTPVLNLSMGPVNAWETAPVPPGHLVLRPALSCAGCWRCAGVLRCRAAFVPGRVAALILALLRRESPRPLPGLRLFRTARCRGLFDLVPIWEKDAARSGREVLSRFWQEWFLACLGGPVPPCGQDAVAAELAAHPELIEALRKAAGRLGENLAAGVRRGTPLDDAFWRALPPVIRPLAGYAHLLLQNGEYGRAAWGDALALAGALAAALQGSFVRQPLPLASADPAA